MNRSLVGGFALIAVGAVLAVAAVATAQDEPAVFGMALAGVGLLMVLAGLLLGPVRA